MRSERQIARRADRVRALAAYLAAPRTVRDVCRRFRTRDGRYIAKATAAALIALVEEHGYALEVTKLRQGKCGPLSVAYRVAGRAMAKRRSA